jgi:TP901 family phage tail tape measure protein
MATRFSLTAELNAQINKGSVQRAVRQLKSEISRMSTTIDIKFDKKATRHIREMTTELKKLDRVGAHMSRTTADMADSFVRVGGNVDRAGKKVGAATGLLEDFGKAGALAAKRFAAFSIATAGFVAMLGAMKRGFSAAVEFETEMRKVAQVLNVTIAETKDLAGSISKLAKGMGVSSSELAKTSRILSQTGMSARDTRIALDALAKTTLSATFDDLTKTGEASIAMMRQFGVSADQLEGKLGSINALAGKFAVEASDLGVVIRRTGGVFAAMGNSVEELEALFTSVRSTTRESAETIATGFRTIFTRLQRKSTITFLRRFGIELQDMTGKFVGGFEAVRRLNAAMSKMDPRTATFAAITEQLGGFRQVSKVIPLIKQFGTAQDALNVAMAGGNSLSADAEKAQGTLAVKIQKVKEQFFELIRKVANNKAFKVMVDLGLRLASAFLKVADALTPLLPMLAALGTMAAFRGIGKVFGGLRALLA